MTPAVDNAVVSGAELNFRLNFLGASAHLEDEDGALTGKTEIYPFSEINFCKQGPNGFITFLSDRPEFRGHVTFLSDVPWPPAPSINKVRPPAPKPPAGPCGCEIYEVCPACDPETHAKLVAKRGELAAQAPVDVIGPDGEEPAPAGQDDSLLRSAVAALKPGDSMAEYHPDGTVTLHTREPQEFPYIPGENQTLIASRRYSAFEWAKKNQPRTVPLPVVESYNTGAEAARRSNISLPVFENPLRFPDTGNIPQEDEVDKLDHSVPEGFAVHVAELVRTRGADYGTAAQNHQATADLWTTWLSARLGVSVTVTPEDVVMLNVLQKASRLAFTTKNDSWFDIAGYAENVAMLRPDQRNNITEL